MKLLLKLTFAGLFHSRARLLLTLSAMVAASAVVAWMVSGFERILSETDEDFLHLCGNYDCIATWPHGKPLSDRQRTLLGALKADARIAGADLCTAADVNCSLFKSFLTPKSQRNRPLVTKEGVAPPVYGLPVPRGRLVGTAARKPPRPLARGYWLGTAGAARIQADSPGSIPCLIDERIARIRGTEPGSRFQTGSLAGSHTMVVVGVIQDAATLPGGQDAASGQPFLLPGTREIFVRQADMAAMCGGEGRPAYLLLAFREPGAEAAAAFVRDWSDRLAGAGMRLFEPGVLKAYFAERNSGARFRFQVYSITGITMLAAFFIIFTSLSMGVSERIRQLAILRAIALNRRQIAGCILLEGLALGLIGWGGGLLLCRALILAMPLFAPRELLSEVRIGVWTVALTGVCSVAGALLASIHPAWKASRINPMEVLGTPRPGSLPRRGLLAWSLAGVLLLAVDPAVVFWPGLSESVRVGLYGFLGSPACVVGFVLLLPLCQVCCRRLFAAPAAWLFRLPGHLLQSQLTANTWRSIGTAVSLSVGLGLYMSSLIWSASMLKPFLCGDWMPDCFAALLPGGFDEEDIHRIRRIPGIDPRRCLPVAIEQTPLAEDLTGSRRRRSCIRQDNVSFFGMDPDRAFRPDGDFFRLRFLQGDPKEARRLLLGDGNHCLVPEHFSQVTGLRLHDSFQVVPPDAPGTVLTYEIAGVVAFKGWHWFSKNAGVRRNAGRTAAMVFASERNVRRNFNLHRLEYFWADLTPGADLEEIRKGLEAIAAANRGRACHIPGLGDARVGHVFPKITTRQGLDRNILRRTRNVVKGMLKLPFTILLICSLAVANTAIASIRSRRQEIGILRSVGIHRSCLARLLLAESIQIALTAAVVSTLYGITSGLCNAQMAAHNSFFGGLGWNFAFPAAAVLKGGAITILISLGAAAVPAFACAFTPPLRLLQNQE